MFNTEAIIAASNEEEVRVLNEAAHRAADAYVQGGDLPEEEQTALFHAARHAHRAYLQARRRLVAGE